ncbi:MAG: HAD family hydrolase [Bacteroidota bacterium]
MKLTKAVFLDRDGVLNREIGDYVCHVEDFVLNDDVIESLKILQKNGYIFIVISNQSGIAKKLYMQIDVEKIHTHFLNIMKKNGINITEIYYCVHHPDVEKCLCRKPDSLMIEKAIARFNIDVSLSFFIGDKERDVQAGNKVGMKSFLIEPNSLLMPIVNLICNNSLFFVH